MKYLIISNKKEIIQISKNQCITIELSLNVSEYGKIWKDIGDRLYYFANPRNSSDENNMYIVSDEKFNFLKQEFNKLSK